MKLPGIDYNPGVKSLGRQDVAAPAREWSAKTNADIAKVGAISNVVKTVGELHTAIETEDAKKRAVELQKNLEKARIKSTETVAYDLREMEDYEFLEGSGVIEQYDAEGNLKDTIDGSMVMRDAWEHNRNKIMQNGLKGMSNAQQQYIRNALGGYVSSTNARVASMGLKAENDRIREQALMVAKDLVDSGNLDGAIESIGVSIPFTDIERLKLRDELTLRHETNLISNATMANDGGTSAARLLRELESPNYQGELTPPKRNAAIADLRRAIKSKAAKQTTAQKVAAAQEKINFERSFAVVAQMDGGDPYSMIQQGVDNGYIKTESDLRRLYKIIDDSNEAMFEQQITANTVAEFVETPQAFSQANSDHKKLVDTFAAQLPERGQQEILASTLNYIPQPLEDYMTGTLMNGSVKDGVDVLQMAMRFDAVSPSIMNSLEAPVKEQIDIATALVRGGQPEEQALSIARESLNTPEEVKNQRKLEVREAEQNYSTKLKKLMNNDETLFNVDIWLGRDVNAVSQMEAEFRTNSDRLYTLTGDWDVAHKTAYSGMRRTWGITEVGGTKRAMKLPPERMTMMPVSSLNTSLADFVRKNAPDELKETPLENVIILSDKTTAYTGLYSVLINDEETGFPYPILNESNAPMKWNPFHNMKGILNEDWQRKAREEEVKYQQEMEERNRVDLLMSEEPL